MKRMIVTTEEELRELREIGRIVAIVLREMMAELRPGISTGALDELAGRRFAELGALSAPMGEYQFPGYTCISVNDEVAHGIPGERIIRAGDMVNIDVSASKNGYFGDTAATAFAGGADDVGERLLKSARRTLYAAIARAKAGERFNELGRTVETFARKDGFTTIRNLCGHGVGRGLHEYPDGIYNYYEPREKGRFKKGMVLAIEPFVSEGDSFVEEPGADGWILRTAHHTRAAQFEHTVMVRNSRPLILTLPD